MNNVAHVEALLGLLGVDVPRHRYEIALTIVVMAGLDARQSWQLVSPRHLRLGRLWTEVQGANPTALGIHSRGAFAQKVIAPLIQAGVLVRNPANPRLPPTSPFTHYALSPPACQLLQASPALLALDLAWSQGLEQAAGRHVSEPIACGGANFLSPPSPGFSQTQALPCAPSAPCEVNAKGLLLSMVFTSFMPRFLPEATLLWFSQQFHNGLEHNQHRLQALNITPPLYPMLPEMLIYADEQAQLWLIEIIYAPGANLATAALEAATASPRASLWTPARYREMEALLQDSPPQRTYLSIFQDFATFNQCATLIAPQTAVWLAEMPTALLQL